MKSRVTIEIDFEFGKPYFKVVADMESEDLRDQAVREFRQALGFDSNWARVRFHDQYKAGQKLFTIEPIAPSDLTQEVEMMTKAVERMKTYPTPSFK